MKDNPDLSHPNKIYLENFFYSQEKLNSLEINSTYNKSSEMMDFLHKCALDFDIPPTDI